MPQVQASDEPLGTLAWREYDVKLRSGCRVKVGFSLADPQDSAIAGMKVKYTASHMGFLVILDDPDSVEEPVLWFRQAGALTIISRNGAMLISEEVKALLPRYFTVFFDELKEIAPGLADVLFVGIPPANIEHLN